MFIHMIFNTDPYLEVLTYNWEKWKQGNCDGLVNKKGVNCFDGRKTDPTNLKFCQSSKILFHRKLFDLNWSSSSLSQESISPTYYEQLLRRYFCAKKSTNLKSKHKKAKKPRVKCWWNWHLIFGGEKQKENEGKSVEWFFGIAPQRLVRNCPQREQFSKVEQNCVRINNNNKNNNNHECPIIVVLNSDVNCAVVFHLFYLTSMPLKKISISYNSKIPFYNRLSIALILNDSLISRAK